MRRHSPRNSALPSIVTRDRSFAGYLTHSELDVPATAAEHGDRLYTVNARLGVADPSTASYSVVQLRK